MKLFISPVERRVTISNLNLIRSAEVVMKQQQQQQHQPKIYRRLPFRSLLPTVLIAGFLLPFLFIRYASIALDSRAAAICHGCFGWRKRLLFGTDASLVSSSPISNWIPLLWGNSDAAAVVSNDMRELEKELRRAFLETAANGEVLDQKKIEAAPDSWNSLIEEMMTSYKHLDVKSFALEAKAMLVKMDRKVQSTRQQTSIYYHLASVGIPKSLHCLTLELAQHYTVNALARCSLPPPNIAHLLTNASYVHIALLTDNVLAAAVAVSSTIASSAEPQNIVFHIITDKKTYTAMHAWFALHQTHPVTVEVKGLHQFTWPANVRANIVETIHEIQNMSMFLHSHSGIGDESKEQQFLSSGSFSILKHLRIHLPDLFPKLEKVILLDGDIVVQRDLVSLWHLDLNGNVNGAVTEAIDEGGYRICIGKKLGDILNFSNPLVYSKVHMESDQCSWLGGLNIFNLQAWRGTNITQRYQQWLKLNRESGFLLAEIGSLAASLVAFDDQIQPIDPSWHLPDLGKQMPEPELLKSSGVLHFSGPRKPWLDIGFPELRQLWRTHINQTNEFVRKCRV